MYFSQEQLEELENFCSETKRKNESLFIEVYDYQFSSEEAREFAIHGFSRRMRTLNRCVDNIYRICPPDIEDKPSTEQLYDIAINLHAFFLNVYGALDNLTYIWVREKNILDENNEPLPKYNIGLAGKRTEVRESFPDSIQEYLNTEHHKKWFSHIENFRHSLSHRIPLYVPPYVTNEKDEEQNKLAELAAKALKEGQYEVFNRLSEELEVLGEFRPWMTHSFSEKSPKAIFHYQILCDWAAVIEICELFIEELKK